MACLIILAFTFEAKINFLGHKLIDSWNERQSFKDKIAEVFSYLKISPDEEIRPYSSICSLKNFRDSIAHGKPIEIVFDEEVVHPVKEIDREIDLEGKWKCYCSHENVFNTYADIDTIWKELLQASNLELFDTITRGESGLTFIEKIVEKD